MKQLLSISLSHQHLVQYNFWLYIFTCLFNLHADYIMWNARLDEAQARIKTAVRNINKLRYADATTLMVGSEEELKESLDEGERGEWKSWLETKHSKN